MGKVGILMGSDSDLAVMSKAAGVLEELGVEYEMHIISAHREASLFFEWASHAEENGIDIIIAGAGMAAHLPGMCAALFPLPVIGVPLSSRQLGGIDAVCSIMQMPPGVPVATMAIDGAKNAGLMAARILSISDKGLREKLRAFSEAEKQKVMDKDKSLGELGYKKYLEHRNS